MSIAIKQFVLGAAGSATAAGDAVLAGGYLKFDLADSNVTAIVPTFLRDYPINLGNIKGGVYQAGQAETLRVVTITPTAANSTDYRIVLSAEKGQAFSNNLPQEVQTVFSYTSKTSGDTATTIGDAFRTAINNHPYWNTRVAVTGTTTIIITAKAGFPIFSAGVGANLASVVSTPGAVAIGIGATMLASGLFTDATYGLPVSGQTYNVISFMYEVTDNGGLSGGVMERVYLYINNNANNSTLLGLLQGFLTYR